MKKPIILALSCIISIASLIGTSSAADKAAKSAQAANVTTMAEYAPIKGVITSIDNSDPSNVKIEVKNESDGSTQTVYANERTEVTKITDTSALKAGDSAVFMTKKEKNKSVVLGVYFGKIKKIMAPAKLTLKHNSSGTATTPAKYKK